jgi:hypothetical protein
MFYPVEEKPSATPTAGIPMTAVNAGATEVTFRLTSTNDGTWKVYDAPAGGNDITSRVWASFNDPATGFLTLKSPDPIAPWAYWVSVTEDGKAESSRFQLWDTPVDGGAARSLASRFHIPDTALPTGHDGADGVSAVFNALHAYIKAHGASSTAPYEVPGIVLGDYIDLPSLTLEGYSGISDGYPGDAAGDYPLVLTNDPIPAGRPWEGTPMLRLIVVGNNSFHSGKGENKQYTEKANDATPHLAFQFQNIPSSKYNRGMGSLTVAGLARMNTRDSATGGYGASGMRQYLTNNYLPGLIGAGVPEAVLFAPKRYVAKDGASAEEIQDLVWLPTMWEMTGGNNGSNGTYETQANQARLEYYDTYDPSNPSEKRKKGCVWGSTSYKPSNYWTASPAGSGPDFCMVDAAKGKPYELSVFSTFAVGVVPAFCVK